MNMSPHSEAVILLTVPFGKTGTKPLSVGEWGRFDLWLKEHELEPSQLVTEDPKSLLSDWKDQKITLQRIEKLLGRGGALGFAGERWEGAGLWIITQSEASYPESLKRRLRRNSPPVLFGCGNRALLNKGGIAVVGSRDADDNDLSFTTDLARSAAEQGLSVVSGGARGVDERAMLGTLENEGTAVGVMADSLLRAATSKKYGEHLRRTNCDLVLVSPFNPEAGFNPGNAMARNKYIYCLSYAAVVVNSTTGKGGTWNGAVENLKSDNHWVPLWVQPKDNPSSGNAALVQKGARQFPREMPVLSSLWETVSGGDAAPEEARSPVQSETATAPDETTTKPMQEEFRFPAPDDADDSSSEPVNDFYSLFLKHLRKLTGDEPMKAADISARLKLEKTQVNAWLKRGVADSEIKKLNRPVRYQSASAPRNRT